MVEGILLLTAYGQEIGRKPANRIFVKILCPACSKERWKSQTHARAAKTLYCLSCSAKIIRQRQSSSKPLSTPDNPFLSHGYLAFCSKSKKIMLHRYLLEQHLGRPLTSAEVVHHINGERADNRLENLVILSHSAHQILHKEQGEQIRLLLWRVKELEEALRLARTKVI